MEIKVQVAPTRRKIGVPTAEFTILVLLTLVFEDVVCHSNSQRELHQVSRNDTNVFSRSTYSVFDVDRRFYRYANVEQRESVLQPYKVVARHLLCNLSRKHIWSSARHDVRPSHRACSRHLRLWRLSTAPATRFATLPFFVSGRGHCGRALRGCNSRLNFQSCDQFKLFSSATPEPQENTTEPCRQNKTMKMRREKYTVVSFFVAANKQMHRVSFGIRCTHLRGRRRSIIGSVCVHE